MHGGAYIHLRFIIVSKREALVLVARMTLQWPGLLFSFMLYKTMYLDLRNDI